MARSVVPPSVKRQLLMPLTASELLWLGAAAGARRGGRLCLRLLLLSGALGLLPLEPLRVVIALLGRRRVLADGNGDAPGRGGRGVDKVAELVEGDDVALEGLVVARVAALLGVAGEDVALERLLDHDHLLALAERDGLRRLARVGDGRVLEACRLPLALGHVLGHVPVGGRVEHDRNADGADVRVVACRGGGVLVLDPCGKVGEDDDVVVGELEVLRVLARAERIDRLCLRLAERGRELRERARALELLDAELALLHRVEVRAAVLEVGLDGGEHRLRHRLRRLLDVHKLDLKVLGAIAARARHLGVLAIAHERPRLGVLRLARPP
mmetsp:Transcript_7419/g.21905  ORF Transcript_7419/g.21905 Transcript_7419/m.21905 type:complete len:327 (-) Transcript_7419:1646-2626(-)